MPPKTHPSIDIEKEEAVCMQMYNRALSQMSQAKLDSSLLSRARDTFEELLRSPLLTNNANEKFSKASKMFKYLAYKNLVSVHTQEGNYAGALECAKKALETDSSDGVLYFRAGALALKQKDYPMAAFLLRKCLEIIPMHWDALNTLLGVLFVLDEFDECNTIADKCLFYNPDNKRAFVLKSYLNSGASHIL